jgi:protein tyrosine/serine phosphatase
MNRTQKVVAVAAVTSGVLTAAGILVYHEWFYIRHFRVVKEGVLYRSGLPDRNHFQRLRDRYGIRTIVDLCPDDDQTGKDGPSLAQERAEAERVGLRFVHLPMQGSADLTDGTVSRWLSVIRDRSTWPVLVHCKRGVDRTGVLVMIYRMEEDGWTPQQALDEAVSLRFDPDSKPLVIQFMLSYRPNAKRQATRPTSRSWTPVNTR